MNKRIIIGKNKYGYYYTVSSKENGKWAVIEYHNDDVGERIEKLLDIKIDNLRLWKNLLLVKTNDDLVVIDNYSQINHDMVFKSFNKQLSKMTNSKILHNKLSLQRKNKFRRVNVGAKVAFSAALAGMLLFPIDAIEAPISNAIVYAPTVESFTTESAVPTYQAIDELQREKLEIRKLELEAERKRVEEEKRQLEEATKLEEERFNNVVMDYSTIFGMNHEQALSLVKASGAEIKNNFQNEELGILTVLLEAYLDNNTIDKTPVTENISSEQRERLLLKYAKVFGITDGNTVVTMLAIHRLETGNGTSDACIYKNNFGGLRAKGTNGYYVISYKNSDIGAIAMVKSFLNIKNRAMNSDRYNPNQSLENNLNYIYCGESTWPGKVSSLKDEVLADYNINQYVEEAKEKQLTKK